MRGFASIGLNRPKSPENVGSVLRAAHVYGASMVAIAGDRGKRAYIKHATNTTKAERHMPVWCGAELIDLIPHGSTPVAVDLVDGAKSLVSFRHPESAFYVFGPEDGTLGASVLRWCPHKIMIPTSHCMNLAATVNVVLYDRLAKFGGST